MAIDDNPTAMARLACYVRGFDIVTACNEALPAYDMEALAHCADSFDFDAECPVVDAPAWERFRADYRACAVGGAGTCPDATFTEAGTYMLGSNRGKGDDIDLSCTFTPTTGADVTGVVAEARCSIVADLPDHLTFIHEPCVDGACHHGFLCEPGAPAWCAAGYRVTCDP